MQNVWLVVVPYVWIQSEWYTLMSKKIRIIFIVDFDIQGFFDLGIHHKLF
jgi:hypothetical protein